MPTLNLTNKILAYKDTRSSNNPKRRLIDWTQNLSGIPSSDPTNNTYSINPYESQTIFNGSRALANDNTTELALSLTTIDNSQYRLKWTGTGTAPLFRTSRTMSVSGGNIVITLNSNQTVTVTSSLGSVFGAVQVGDIVKIPGISTGDAASVFDPLNEGFWTVLSSGASTLVLSRDDVFSGKTETVAITSASQFTAYSNAGVQVGDVLDLTASNFAVSSRKIFPIVGVTDVSVDFISTLPLSNETKIPGTTGVSVYTNSKFFVYIESDQEIVAYFNGNTTDNDVVEPLLQGPDGYIGFLEKVGTTYALSIKNRASQTATVMVVAAER